jgi:hypothetical protein
MATIFYYFCPHISMGALLQITPVVLATAWGSICITIIYVVICLIQKGSLLEYYYVMGVTARLSDFTNLKILCDIG